MQKLTLWIPDTATEAIVKERLKDMPITWQPSGAHPSTEPDYTYWNSLTLEQQQSILLAYEETQSGKGEEWDKVYAEMSDMLK